MCCTDRVSQRLLTRKKQQTRREVKRARRTWHRSRNARVECTVGEHVTVHSTVLSSILFDLQPWPLTPFAQPLQHRGVHAWHAQFKACLGYYCAHSAPLVVQLRILPPRTSNARVCLILIRCRHCVRLSFIVLHRMLFVGQYFRHASGSRGSGRCLYIAW